MFFAYLCFPLHPYVPRFLLTLFPTCHVLHQVEGDLLLLDPACHELRYPRVPQPVDMAKQLGRNGGGSDDLVDDFEVAAGVEWGDQG